MSVSGGRKDRNFFVDSVFLDTQRYSLLYAYGKHVAVMGSTFDDVDDEHLLRSWLTNSLVAHNVFRGGRSAKHQLKFLGMEPGVHAPFVKGEYNIISDNRFFGPVGSWMITIGTQDSNADQRIVDGRAPASGHRFDP